MLVSSLGRNGSLDWLHSISNVLPTALTVTLATEDALVAILQWGAFDVSVEFVARASNSVSLALIPTCTVTAVDKGVPFIGNVIGYSGKDGDMRDKFEQYGDAFVMKTGPRSEVLCINQPEDISAMLSSKAFIPAWPGVYL